MSNYQANFNGINWFCDECGAYLNAQNSFDESKGHHVCEECGYDNDLSEENIVDRPATLKEEGSVLLAHGVDVVASAATKALYDGAMKFLNKSKDQKSTKKDKKKNQKKHKDNNSIEEQSNIINQMGSDADEFFENLTKIQKVAVSDVFNYVDGYNKTESALEDLTQKQHDAIATLIDGAYSLGKARYVLNSFTDEQFAQFDELVNQVSHDQFCLNDLFQENDSESIEINDNTTIVDILETLSEEQTAAVFDMVEYIKVRRENEAVLETLNDEQLLACKELDDASRQQYKSSYYLYTCNKVQAEAIDQFWDDIEEMPLEELKEMLERFNNGNKENNTDGDHEKLKQYKKMLDDDLISQEEYDQLKKEILGL